MARTSRLRLIGRLALAASLLAVTVGAQLAAPSSAVALSRWTGGIDLYRSGVFTTQKSWLWCTAADVQIIRNIARHQADHSRAGQQRYFDYMRAHNRYRIPVADGVDPAGWTAGLRNFVDGRYRLVASGSFDAALRSAVTNLRKSNLPVGITVSHGNHAWVLTGFTATADPAVTTRFTVTSVRVVGSLYGLQSRSYGYDMAPDRKLTPAQLRGFFTPWHYARIRMVWEGRWVSIQPVAAAPVSAPTSAVTPKPQAAATPAPTPTPTLTPTPTPAPTPAPSPTPALIGLADPGASRSPDAGSASSTAPLSNVGTGPPIALALAIALAIAIGVFTLASRRARPTS